MWARTRRLVDGSMRRRLVSAFVVCAAIIMWPALPAYAGATLPAVLESIASFRGQLTYQAHPADDVGLVIQGTLDVGPDGWVVDESTADRELHASSRDSWIRFGTQTLTFDDPLTLEQLANPWAIVLATTSGQQLSADAGGTSWTTSSGTRLYLDPSRIQVIGAADPSGGVAFAFSNWTDVNGIALPRSIERLRSGVVENSLTIDGYGMRTTGDPQSGAAAAPVPVAPGHEVPIFVATAPVQTTLTSEKTGLRLWGFAIVLFALAVGVVIWLRRDTFVERVAHSLAGDPRAWRRAGMNIFVSPEGVLTFEGRRYRVGSVFFNRPVLIQTSPLFVRVSAPGESRTLILARKFPRPAAVQRRAATGFTLVESLAACALFAIVIVGAVFPALVVLASADRLAAQHQMALQVAANALTDEETALAYGWSIDDGVRVATVDGMTLTETVAKMSLTGLHSLTIEVADPGGRSLAREVTLLGPPVPPPGAGASPPPSGGR
jgi:type II secretory pathway pseudopilin PulG